MEKRLNIGLFIDTFFPMVDGVIMVVDNYARILSRFANVTVFGPKGRKNFDDSTLPYKVVRCGRIVLNGLDYDLPLPNLDINFHNELRKAELDIVHIHSPFSIGKAGLTYAKRHKIPCVATMHSQYKQDFFNATKSKMITNSMLKTIMRVFNKCDECWAVNNQLAKVFLEYGAKTLPKTQNNGTDTSFYENEQEILKLRQKYDVKDDEKIFLFVGRLTVLKNILFTVRVLKILKEQGFKFKMLFVGSGKDEELLKEEIKSCGLEKEIVLVGQVKGREEICKYYRAADLFLFPSLYDASSLVQIEAAAQKTPTLFIRAAVTSETITEDVNGFLADNDEKAYAEKILKIFSDEEYYKKVSEGAFRDLYLSWEDAVNRAYNDYLGLISSKKSKGV